MPDLLAHEPVCLTMDWSGGPRARFYGRPAPDTLVLLPSRGERHGFEDNADAWGRVALAPSQQDRQGGGWLWWVAGDTLSIRAMTPTMEDLGVQAIRPDAGTPALWVGEGWESDAQRGPVSLHPYKCSELPASAP